MPIWLTPMMHPGRDLLRGNVEVDEAYIGGPEVGIRGGRQWIDKALVVAAVELRGEAPVRVQVEPDASAGSLTGFVQAKVSSNEAS